MIVGVLALQGDFAKHIDMLRSLGVTAKEVRKAEDLQDCQGLIIPGGESTVILRHIDVLGLRQDLELFAAKQPVFGTCAGLIVMATHVQDLRLQPLGLLPLTVERNAFGRQIESFQSSVELFLESNHPKLIRPYFIRAPRICAYDPSVEILACLKGEPVLVRQGHHLGATFHSELTTDTTIHRYFLHMIQDKRSR